MQAAKMATSFRLEELARRAGVSPRTVRYYIQRGLLPGPEFRGPDTQYGERHWVALRAIRALQEGFMPLDAIAATLQGKSLDELRSLAAKPPRAAPRADARASSPPLPAARLSAAQSGRRFVLADGLELWQADHADQAVSALAEAIRELSAKRHNDGGADE
jgi:DNA-binding transcriptional MerR regulator